MGFLDRLEDIVGGAWDMGTAPFAVAYDLIRAIPDPNISVGDAFGGGLERFVGGLAQFSQATGLSSLGQGVGTATNADDVLGKIFQELELYYSSGYQEQIGRAPWGLGTLSGGRINPGDISISRGLGTITGSLGAAMPGGEPLQRGLGQAWNRSRNTSPGRMWVMNRLGMWDMTPEEFEQASHGLGFTLESGAIDAVLRWFAQPEIIAGKAIARGVRARWHPTVLSRIDRFQSQFGMEASEPSWLQVTPRSGMSRDQVTAVIRRDLEGILRNPETGHLPGDFDAFVTEVVDRIAPNARLSKEGFSYLPQGVGDTDPFTPVVRRGASRGTLGYQMAGGPERERLIQSLQAEIDRLNQLHEAADLHPGPTWQQQLEARQRELATLQSAPPSVEAPAQINAYARNATKLAEYLSDQPQGAQGLAAAGEVLPMRGAGYKASLGNSFESGEIPYQAEFGGAVNMQVNNARGQHVYHVTRLSNLRSLQARGLVRPDLGGVGEEVGAFFSRMQRDFQDVIEFGSNGLPTRLLGETPTPEALTEAGDYLADWVRRWGFDQVNQGKAGTVSDIIELLNNIPQAALAELSPLAKTVFARDLISHVMGEVESGASLGGVSATRAVGELSAEPPSAIYLLGEDELPEAYRYAAALYHADPTDPAVIIKINPEGLPVVYDDFTSPLVPDPRSGLPSDASLITTADAIKPGNILSVEQVPGALFSEERLVDLIRGGHAQYPDYLMPGGRVHDRLFNPDATPIEPGDVAHFDEISEAFNTATHVYSTQGEAAAVRFLKSWQHQRGRASGATDLPTYISGDKRFQSLLNEMNGKDADWIRRVVFPRHPAGAVMSSLLSQAKTYEERRLILLSCMGISTPEMVTLPAITRARLKALRGDLDVLHTSKADVEARAAINEAAITESERVYLDETAYKQMEEFVLGEIKEQTRVEALTAWLDHTQKMGGVISEMPMLRQRSRLAETIRNTSWFQESALARPIRSVIEKRPYQFINVHDPHADIQIVRQLQEARPLGITQERVRYYRDRWMKATTEAEKSRVAHQMDNELVRAAAKRAGLPKEEIEELVTYANHGRLRTGQFLQSRRYAPRADMDIVRWHDVETGEWVEMALPMLGTQLQNWIPLTDVRGLIAVSTRIRRVRMRIGRVPKEMMDSFYHLWKPSVLLRGGWPIRVVSDEQLRILARTGSLIKHLAGIETGDLPRWTAYDKSQTGAQRVASTFGLVSTVPVAAVSRVAAALAKGAKKLRMYDPKWYADLESCGYEKLASSRAAFAGPHESINLEFEKLIGFHEAGIMDHLIHRGSGQWGTVAQDSRYYGQSWKRVLQDQLGRDPMAREAMQVIKESGYMRGLGETEAIQRSLTAWANESGLLPEWLRGSKEMMDNLSNFLRTMPEGISDWTEYSSALDTFFRYHLGKKWLGSDHIDNAFVDEMAHDLVSDMPHWRVGEFTARSMEAGTHHAGWQSIHSMLVKAVSRHKVTVRDVDLERMTDDIYAHYDYHAFGATDPGIGLSAYPDFESFLDSYLMAQHQANVFGMLGINYGDTGFLLALKDDILESIGKFLPEDPRVQFAPVRNPAAHLVRWLNDTKEGAEYATRLPWRTDHLKWAEDVVEMVNYHTAGFEPALVDAALAKKVPMKLFESIDQSRRPPTIHSEVVDQVIGNSAITSAISEFLSTSFDLMGRLPTDTLSRQPFFRHMYANEMQRMRNTLDAQGLELSEEAFQWASGHARNYALGEVNRWLYNLAESSRFGAMMRWYLPFFPAWQEVLTVWAGLIKQDPSIIGRALLLWRAPNKAGLIETDDKGDEYITFRMSERMADSLHLTGWSRFLATGGLRFGKTSFNLVLNSPLPGAGPPIQIPVNQVIQNKPELESALNWLMPFGVKANVWEVLGSPLLRRTNSFIQGQDGDKSFERDFYNIMVWEDWRYRTGQRTDPPTYDEVTSEAQKLFTVRLGFNLLSPSQPIFDSPLKPYIDIYRSLIETVGPDQADEIFLNAYGNELFAVTLSRTVSSTGIPPTVEAQVARRQFEGLIGKYPEYGRLIVGDDASVGEFSTAAFVWQLTHATPSLETPLNEPERVYRELTLDPETGRIEEIDRRLGWNEYIKMVDLIDVERRNRGLPNLKVSEARDLTTIKTLLTQRIAAEYPAWWRDINERNDLDWANTIKAIREIAFSPLMEDRPDLEGVRAYFTARDVILAELNRRKQLDGSSSLDATSNLDLAQAWETLVYSIIEDNVAFSPIYYRYLEGDPVRLRAELVSVNG